MTGLSRTLDSIGNLEKCLNGFTDCTKCLPKSMSSFRIKDLRLKEITGEKGYRRLMEALPGLTGSSLRGDGHGHGQPEGRS